MINIQITKELFWNNDTQAYVILLKEDLAPLDKNISLDNIEKDFSPNLKSILKQQNFNGKKGESFVLPVNKDNKLINLVFIGLGKLDGQWNNELENLRRAIGTIVLTLKKLKIKNSVINLPDEKAFGLSLDKLFRQLVIAACMADYEFVEFKTDKKEKWEGRLLFALQDDNELFDIALKEGLIIGEATNKARYFADMPSNYITPTSLSKDAEKIAKDYNLNFKVFGADEAEKLGMGGFIEVEKGSDEPGKFVVLEYKVKENVPTIALVGKGVTYDAGGISIKPPTGIGGLEGMKFDMCGAAAVIGAMKAIAQLKPNVNVIGITPLVENMPSGKSSKQDDIITFMNGKTAEIKNTDAEGRLILADALCYAEKNYNPEVIMDIATLTGACVRNLGHFFTGLMTKDEIIGTKLQAVSLITGDRVWPLPLDDDFKDAIKSDVADMSNTGAYAYQGGTVTAAWFLKNFVDKSKWAHLDIAGTGDSVPGISYLGKGATGAGVRLLTEFVLNYNKK